MPSKIRYKVVNKNRQSCVIDDLGYILSYGKDSIVEAKDDTLGVFCFKRKKDAEKFKGTNGSQKIIRALPLSRGKVPKSIFRFYTIEQDYQSCIIYNIDYNNLPKNFYNNESKMDIPNGTICYKKVKVLD